MRLTVYEFVLQNPVWSTGAAGPGDEVDMTVTATRLTAGQTIEFRIHRANELIDIVTADPGTATAKWKVPNFLTGAHSLTFVALMREAVSPGTTHQLVQAKTPPSPNLQVQGYQIDITAFDAAFVPSQENLNVTYTLTDAGAKAANGRYEVWGERYPGDEPKPLYEEDFVPAAGATTWSTWDGTANKGLLDTKLIRPEFSPFRIRILVAPSAEALDDQYGVGLGLVGCAEATFEVKFQSVAVRVQPQGVGAGQLNEKTTEDDYKLAAVLKVDPPGGTRAYAASGRLPNPAQAGPPVVAAETGRIRIPMARHSNIKDPLDSGGVGIGDKYMENDGKTKWKVDDAFYMRPELPLEFEGKLTSRNAGANPDGLFEADAVGEMRIEPLARENYQAALLNGLSEHQRYMRSAAFKVKKGRHDKPFHNPANNPECHYWTSRLVVAADGDQDFTVTDFEPPNPIEYRVGQKELSVYLNRTLLVRCDRADNNDLDREYKDYRETGTTTIRLRPNLTKAGDILWVVRKDSTASGKDKVKDWQQFPPGANCHVHYGGVRGEKPSSSLSNYFRKNWSDARKHKPVIGKATADFDYEKYIELKPEEKVSQAKQERVVIGAMPDDPHKGIAAVLFSPSYIGGDNYTIEGWLDWQPYLRNFGCVDLKPAMKGETGEMSVWRWCRIDHSYRLPDIGTNGLAATVGGEAELPVGGGLRVYPGNGANMLVDGAPLSNNTMFEEGFTEWTLEAPGGGAGVGEDAVHRNVNLASYRQAHNGATSSWGGHVNLNNNNLIQNHSVVWDAYRWALPPGIPANRVNVTANTIHGLPDGTPTADAGAAVENAIGLLGAAADPPLALNVDEIDPYPNNDPDDYNDWMDGRWDTVMHAVLDELTPEVKDPERQNVVRWPMLHEHGAWIGFDAGAGNAQYAGGITNGFCRGGGQSMFRTATLNAGVRVPDITETFPHEMGHSMNLVHFVAGNFAWKHHDVNWPQCLMSYDYCAGIILKPGSAVGPNGGTKETGWPDAVPNPIDSNTSGATASNIGDRCIHFLKLEDVGPARAKPCAKCMLKMRGWKDDLLPFAWLHPDLF